MITTGSTTTVNFFVADTDGLPATGQASNISASISIDGGTETAISETITEIDSTNQPGWYRFNYTFATAGNAFITFVCSGCVIMPWEENIVELSGGSAPSAADVATAVWAYSEGRTITNVIPSATTIASAVWNANVSSYTTPRAGYLLQNMGAVVWGYSGVRTVTNTIPTTSDIRDAVWGEDDVEAMDLIGSSAVEYITDSVWAAEINQGAANNTAERVLNAIPTATQNASAVWSDTTGYSGTSSKGAKFLTSVSDVANIKTATTATSTALNAIESGVLNWAVANNVLTLYNSDNTVLGTYNLTRDSEGNIVRVQPTE